MENSDTFRATWSDNILAILFSGIRTGSRFFNPNNIRKLITSKLNFCIQLEEILMLRRSLIESRVQESRRQLIDTLEAGKDHQIEVLLLLQ
jgi:hypothetical protein